MRCSVALALLTGCSQILGITDPSSGPEDDQPPGDGRNPGDAGGPSTCSTPPVVPMFDKQITLTPPGPVTSFAIGHLDSDATVDLAVAIKLDTFLFLGDGQGGFSQRQMSPGMTAPADEIAILDFSGDGLADLVSITGSSTGWHLNRRIAAGGQLEYSSTETAVVTGSSGGATALFPLDIDGSTQGQDLVVGTSNGEAVVYSNANFPMPVKQQSGHVCGAFDADGDSFGDVVLDEQGILTLFNGDGANPFGAGMRVLSSETECGAAVGTLADGSIGRTLYAGGSGHIDQFVPSGPAFIQSRFFTDIPLPKDGDTLQVIDANGDDRDDVFADGALVLTCPTGPAGVAAEPDGQPLHLTDPGGRAKLADMNGDGKPDLVEISNDGIQISLQK